MNNALRSVLAIVLLSIFLVGEAAAAYSIQQAGTAAAAGAVTGAVIGSFIPGLGTLLGAGIGALAGFVADSVVQLFTGAPTSATNQTLWNVYAKDVYASIASQSQLIADQEITQVNLLQQSQLPFVLTAQKWEQVNYNQNINPSNPYQFYEMLQQTGFLSYATKLVQGMQGVWITEQTEINSVNSQITPHNLEISYNINPANNITYHLSSQPYIIIVIGNITVYSSCSTGPYGTQYFSTTYYKVTPNGTTPYIQLPNSFAHTQLPTGSYYVYPNANLSILVDPQEGMALIFQYASSTYTPVASVGFYQPAYVYLQNTTANKAIQNTTLPQEDLTAIAQEVAISMLGAAQSEYTVLKTFGYTNASTIPPNITLPTINLNIGNFSNFSSSLQAYNLYLAQYVRELLQIQQTLQQLLNESRLAGLQQLNFNVTNPITVYGQYGGFIFNGTIKFPNGEILTGLFLIQPYGGPLTLTANGGTVGSGGAIAYKLIQFANGYALGQEYTLPPGTVLIGNVQNPGTLGTTINVQNAYYLNQTSFQNPFTTTSANATLNRLVGYLETHPLVLLITIFLGLIIIVAVIKALAG